MIYFVSNNSDGCWYYRCYLPQLYNGFSGDKKTLGSQKLDGLESSQIAMRADTVVFQRPDGRDRLKVACLLKKMGKKIVFENDDTYKIGDPMKFEILDGKLHDKIKNLDDFIRIADLVTTTTEYLADEYRKLNKNVVVLKNCINPSDWPNPKRNESDAIRIGLFGSTTLNGDFDPITPILQALSKRKDVQLVMFGLPAKENQKGVIGKAYKEEIDYWGALNVEHHPFVSIKDYFSTLNDLRLDIALIPRKDNYFNRCKSNLKFLEASMCEIPVIAQGFPDGLSPYQGIEDAKRMIIAHTEADWWDGIDSLMADKELRRRIGKEAKEYVLTHYNIQKTYSAWKQALSNI